MDDLVIIYFKPTTDKCLQYKQEIQAIMAPLRKVHDGIQRRAMQQIIFFFHKFPLSPYAM
jgi:hypothetical protein